MAAAEVSEIEKAQQALAVVKLKCDEYNNLEDKGTPEAKSKLISVTNLIEQYHPIIIGYLALEGKSALSAEYGKIKERCKTDLGIGAVTGVKRGVMPGSVALELIKPIIERYYATTPRPPAKRLLIAIEVVAFLEKNYIGAKKIQALDSTTWEQIEKIVNSAQSAPWAIESFVDNVLKRFIHEAPQIQVVPYKKGRTYSSLVPFKESDTIEIEGTTYTFDGSELNFKNGGTVHTLSAINTAIQEKKLNKITIDGAPMDKDWIESFQVAINWAIRGESGRKTYVFIDDDAIDIYGKLKTVTKKFIFQADTFDFHDDDDEEDKTLPLKHVNHKVQTAWILPGSKAALQKVSGGKAVELEADAKTLKMTGLSGAVIEAKPPPPTFTVDGTSISYTIGKDSGVWTIRAYTLRRRDTILIGEDEAYKCGKIKKCKAVDAVIQKKVIDAWNKGTAIKVGGVTLESPKELLESSAHYAYKNMLDQPIRSKVSDAHHAVGIWNGHNHDLSYDDNHYAPMSQWNDDVYASHSSPFDGPNRYHPLISGEYNDESGSSGSSLLIGGVVGASAVVIIMLIFCVGLALGMVIYWGYSQKRALDVKKEKGEMRNWIDDDEDRNEV
eukprot:509375_1